MNDNESTDKQGTDQEPKLPLPPEPVMIKETFGKTERKPSKEKSDSN